VVNEGEVFRLLSKPWQDEEIRAAVAAALGTEPREWSRRQSRIAQRLRDEADRPGDTATKAANPRPAVTGGGS
jgi:hypothetical protein